MYPLLTRLPLVNKENIFDPDNIELALLQLPSETWELIQKPQIVKNADDTYTTGDPFFDKLEQALADGGNLEDVLRQYNPK